MQVTLELYNGRVIAFSGVANISVSNEKIENKEIVETRPVEGKWFEVKPLAIEQKLFKKKRNDARQESTRKLILEAFSEMRKNPKYEKAFKTLIPEKPSTSRNVGELKVLASTLGDHNADWIEQALEWAQRISNGETWETVCNEKDTAKWQRLVVWKEGYCRFIGGSHENNNSATYVGDYDYCDFRNIFDAVPLVVSYM